MSPTPERTFDMNAATLLTYEQVARLAGVSPRRVRRWVEEGKLAYTPLPSGRGRRVSRAQWLAYVMSANRIATESRHG